MRSGTSCSTCLSAWPTHMQGNTMPSTCLDAWPANMQGDTTSSTCLAAWPGRMHRDTSCLAVPPRASMCHSHAVIIFTATPHASLATYHARQLPPRTDLIDRATSSFSVHSSNFGLSGLLHLRPEIQAQVETDSLLAEACGKGTSSSRISEADSRAAIDREIQESIDRAKKKPFDINMPPSIDRQSEFGRRAFDLFGARKFHWEDRDEYEIYRDDQGCARDMDGHIINVTKEEIRKLMERASRDEPSYICLPEHASLFTQTKLVLEIYTKDEINEMFYGVCGEHEKNKEAFQMKLDGIYYPLNDSISWLTTCMEEMKQDIARIQHATDVA
ncbi:hypothetical protein DY000_02048142 [Brassica cretica]|uniref:Uncharacterized protein n=1 Tax=Brassica cretica TaxID=69181 RepID=A0ABQ7EW12_BRACR|nr:hypothetical protein DY000_02048142 [Brassica cretica]